MYVHIHVKESTYMHMKKHTVENNDDNNNNNENEQKKLFMMVIIDLTCLFNLSFLTTALFSNLSVFFKRRDAHTFIFFYISAE